MILPTKKERPEHLRQISAPMRQSIALADFIAKWRKDKYPHLAANSQSSYDLTKKLQAGCPRLIQAQNTTAESFADRSMSIWNIQLLENMAHMGSHGVSCDAKLLWDALFGMPVSKQGDDLIFSSG